MSLSVRDFEIISKIGAGSYGVVYKVKSKVENKLEGDIKVGEICDDNLLIYMSLKMKYKV